MIYLQRHWICVLSLAWRAQTFTRFAKKLMHLLRRNFRKRLAVRSQKNSKEALLSHAAYPLMNFADISRHSRRTPTSLKWRTLSRLSWEHTSTDIQQPAVTALSSEERLRASRPTCSWQHGMLSRQLARLSNQRTLIRWWRRTSKPCALISRSSLSRASSLTRPRSIWMTETR